jgi:hypothetical protein
MPWVRGHVRSYPRNGRRYGYAPYNTGMIVLITLGVFLVIYLITR